MTILRITADTVDIISQMKMSTPTGTINIAMPIPAYRSGATNPVGKTLVYSDLSSSLVPHPITGAPSVLTNGDAVAQAVKSVILRNRYEWIYQRDLGDTVRERVFELFGSPRITELRRLIQTALQNHEPRATLLDVQIVEERDDNRLVIRIVFRPEGSADPVEIDVLLERIR